MTKNRFTAQSYFSLVELLIVIAVLAILASLISPALKKAMEHGHRIVCMDNFKQIAIAGVIYANDNDGYLAPQNSNNKTQDPFVDSVYTGHPAWHGLNDVPSNARGLGILVRGGYLPIMTHLSHSSHKFSVTLMCPTEQASNNRDFPCRYSSDPYGRDWYVTYTSYYYFGGLKYTEAFVRSNQNRREPRARITDWPGASIARDISPFTHRQEANVLYLDGHVESRQLINFTDYDNGYRARQFED
jgi:prepilin-type processing-associated H-X9-DG protein/prepilin-type N-terminal cleavage/methylation domain-containing protein